MQCHLSCRIVAAVMESVPRRNIGHTHTRVDPAVKTCAMAYVHNEPGVMQHQPSKHVRDSRRAWIFQRPQIDIPRCLTRKHWIMEQQLISSHVEKPSKHRRSMTCCAVRSTRGCAGQHSRVVLLIGSTPTRCLFFCARSQHTREDLKDLSSFTAFPFLPTTSRCASPASISQQGVVVAAVLDAHDDIASSIQSTSFEGSFNRGLLHLQLDPFQLENLLYLLMVGGSPLYAFLTPRPPSTLVRRGVESCREIVISLPTFL